MEGSNRREGRRKKEMGSGEYRQGFYRKKRSMVLILLALCLIFPVGVYAKAGEQIKEKIAVLPFQVYAPQPLENLRTNLQQMLAARLLQYGLTVLSPEQVNRLPNVFLPQLDLKEMQAISRELQAEILITGSLTQVGGKISLDLKSTDMSGAAPPFSLFMVDEEIDRLSETMERASKSLYNHIAGVVQIDSLQVTGNQRIESEAVLAVVESKKGDILDQDLLDKDLRAIYGMGFFKDVGIETADGAKGKIVTFNVSERASIGRISFAGNKKLKEEDLKKESGIKLYSIVDQGDIKQSVNRLKEFYLLKGYYNVEIKEKITDLPRNEFSLTYEIVEGDKVYITKIQFSGNSKFSEKQLKKLMETSEKGIFSFITSSGVLDKKILEFDLQKITAFYNNHGYIRAKTGEPEITYEKGVGLIITTEIVEGPQYAVNEVKIEGDLIKPVDELLEKVTISKEKFFNREIVRKDSLALREIYADEGYAYAEIAPYVNEDDKNTRADITYRVSRGNKVRFERINITGNTKTRDRVIRRELESIEGEYYTGDGLRKSNRNLNRLGYFEDVELQTVKGSQEDRMVLNIHVKERPTGAFSIGAGYSSFDKMIGMVQVSQNNLFGNGQKIAATLRAGSRTTEFDITFVEPWFLGRRIAAAIDLYKWKAEYSEYTKDSMGGSLTFNIPLGIDEFTKGLVKYAYDNSDISEFLDDAALGIKEMAGKNITSSMTFGLNRDSKDRPWNASRGSDHAVTFEYAGGAMGGDVYFNRYEARSAWYFPWRWDTVFMLRGKWGYVAQRSGGKLPIFQKYRLGGINTVRGFDYADISPRDPATGDRIGGEKMMVYNLEYRFPLLKEQGVVGVLFFDAGNVFTKDQSYTFSGIRRSAGAGIRWYSPIGPLRLEYGWNLNPQEDEGKGNMEFSIGGLF